MEETPKTKEWWKSKILWSMVLLILSSGLETLQLFLESGDYSPAAITGLVIGILGSVFRIGFTDTKLI